MVAQSKLHIHTKQKLISFGIKKNENQCLHVNIKTTM